MKNPEKREVRSHNKEC